jgi:hypothetical protein
MTAREKRYENRGGQISFAEAGNFYFTVIFVKRAQKWRPVWEFDTRSLKPPFHLKKLRILRV